MHPHHRFAVAAYVVAAVLIVSTMLDVLQAAWPFQLGLVNWRVLVIGAAARILSAPIIGLILAFGAAVVLEQPRVLRSLAVLNLAMAVVIPVGLVFYALDVLQLRAQVMDANRSQYDVGIFVSFSRYGLGFLALLAMAWGAWGAAGGVHARPRPRQQDGEAASLVFQAGGKDRSEPGSGT